jgi:hypothetical protein
MEGLLGIFAGVYGIYVMFGNVNLGWQARLDRGLQDSEWLQHKEKSR